MLLEESEQDQRNPYGEEDECGRLLRFALPFTFKHLNPISVRRPGLPQNFWGEVKILLGLMCASKFYSWKILFCRSPQIFLEKPIAAGNIQPLQRARSD
jgi:hypothetical protein